MLTLKTDKLNNFILVNDETILNCKIKEISNVTIGNKKALSVVTNKTEDFELILTDLDLFVDRIWELKMPNYEIWQGINLSVSFNNDEEWWCKFYLTFSENWKYTFTIDQYVTEFARIKGSKFVDVEFIGNPGEWIGVEILSDTEDRNHPPINLFSRTLNIVSRYNNEAIEILSDVANSKIKFFFDFPSEAKFFCEQYLLYFIQFLQDLGVNATTSFKEEAGKVLFSVTPTDDIEALDKIREALAIYLNLPSSPIVYDDSFAAMRLQQQIENLQHSQKMAAREIRAGERELLLAQTVIEQQDNLIRQKDTTIEQQNRIIEKIISPTIMMDSVENKEEFEQIYDGVRIGESKWLKELTGIGLNPVKAVKKAVDNTFGKPDENKSILGLNEED